MIDKNILKKEIENYYLDLFEYRVMDEVTIQRTTKGVPTKDVRMLLVLYESIYSWIEKILNGDKLDADMKLFCIETIIELLNGGPNNGQL